MFTPVVRSSYRWQDYYDQRSAVERVNSRLAGGSGPSVGHPRAGESAAAYHYGDDHHAGDCLGAHLPRPEPRHRREWLEQFADAIEREDGTTSTIGSAAAPGDIDVWLPTNPGHAGHSAA